MYRVSQFTLQPYLYHMYIYIYIYRHTYVHIHINQAQIFCTFTIMHCAFQVFCPCCEIVAKGDPDPPPKPSQTPKWMGRTIHTIHPANICTYTNICGQFTLQRVVLWFSDCQGVGCLWTGRVSLDRSGVFGRSLDNYLCIAACIRHTIYMKVVPFSQKLM